MHKLSWFAQSLVLLLLLENSAVADGLNPPAHFKVSILAALFLHGGAARGDLPRSCESLFEGLDEASWIEKPDPVQMKDEALASLRTFRKRLGIRPYPADAHRGIMDGYWQGDPSEVFPAHIDKTRTELGKLEQDLTTTDDNVMAEGVVLRGDQIAAYLSSVQKVARRLDQVALQSSADSQKFKNASVAITAALEAGSGAGIFLLPGPFNFLSGVVFSGATIFGASPLFGTAYDAKVGKNDLLDLKFRDHDEFAREFNERPNAREADYYMRRFKAQPVYADELQKAEFDRDQFVDQSLEYWASRYGIVGYMLYLNDRARRGGGWVKSIAERRQELYNRDLYVNQFVSIENGQPTLSVYLRIVSYQKK